jgi:hypothetical protein
MAPKSVPVAATPTVPRSITAARGPAMGTRLTWNKRAMSGTTTTSTASTNPSTPSALPHQMAARGTGVTSSPSSADSSRSRCHVRPSARMEEKAIESQSAPGATRVVVSGPVANEMLAMTATSAAKKPAVVTISLVATSMRRSFARTVSVA